MRPIIGLTTSVENGRQHLDLRYVDAVQAAGGVPRILPAVTDRDVAIAAADGIQGLVIPGGPALTEGVIGELPDDIDAPDPRRSASDGWYLEWFEARQRPILGICYGMQLLNARRGGTLYADVQRQIDGTQVHSSVRGGTEHPMLIEADSHLARVLGRTTVDVNTRHIQAVAEPGEGLRIVGRAPDGVVEALETEDGRILAVQFHPERQIESMLPLFQELVRRASA